MQIIFDKKYFEAKYKSSAFHIFIIYYIVVKYHTNQWCLKTRVTCQKGPICHA